MLLAESVHNLSWVIPFPNNYPSHLPVFPNVHVRIEQGLPHHAPLIYHGFESAFALVPFEFVLLTRFVLLTSPLPLQSCQRKG